MEPRLEIISHDVNSSIHAFLYEEDYFKAPWHFHEEYELTYIIRSNGIRYVGNSIENFQSGEVVLIGSLIPHVWKNAEAYNQGASSVCVQWKPEKFLNIFKELPEFMGVNKLLQNANSGIYFKPSKFSSQIGKRLLNLLELNDGQKITVFIEVLVELSQSKDFSLLSKHGNGLTSQAKIDNRIRDIFSFIEKNYSRKVTIDELADVTCMTKTYFCKFFKNRFNKTFTQYLNEFRIHNVCHQLRNSDASISQIAMDCGYENLSYFHRQFFKIMRTTPAKYRREFQDLSI